MKFLTVKINNSKHLSYLKMLPLKKYMHYVIMLYISILRSDLHKFPCFYMCISLFLRSHIKRCLRYSHSLAQTSTIGSIALIAAQSKHMNTSAASAGWRVPCTRVRFTSLFVRCGVMFNLSQ